MNDKTPGNWSMHWTQSEDGPSVWHLRQSPPEGTAPSDFPVLATVKWTYADQGPPSKETLAELQAFEQDIASLDAPQGNSVLAMIFRGEGDSELHYYCKDFGRFIKELNTALAGKPRVPIDIFHEADADWSYWQEVRSSLTT